MEIIAETRTGFLITATKKEVESIVSSVSGTKPEKLAIGQKIPAIDYAATIEKVITLKEDYDFQQIFFKINDFNVAANKLRQTVDKAAEINI